jgi:hypothetical protein
MGRDELPRAIGTLSHSYENRAVHTQSMLRLLLYPGLIIFPGGLIGFVIVSLFLPLVKLINSVSSGSPCSMTPNVMRAPQVPFRSGAMLPRGAKPTLWGVHPIHRGRELVDSREPVCPKGLKPWGFSPRQGVPSLSAIRVQELLS